MAGGLVGSTKSLPSGAHHGPAGPPSSSSSSNSAEEESEEEFIEENEEEAESEDRGEDEEFEERSLAGETMEDIEGCQRDAELEETEGAEEAEFDEESRHAEEEDMYDEEDRDSERSESETPTSVADSPPSGRSGAYDEEEAMQVAEESGEEEMRGADIAVNRAGGDETFYNEETGLLWIRHRARRRRYVVPGGPGCPFPVEYFKLNRWTRCENADQDNPLEVIETEDNWQYYQDCEGPFEWWTGWTVFQVHGYDAPGHFPWGAGGDGGDDTQPGREDEMSDGEDRGDEADGGSQGDARSSGEGARGQGAEEPGDHASSNRQGGTRRQAGKAGTSTWSSFEAENIKVDVERAAFQYIKVIDEVEDQEAATWRKVCLAGDDLLRRAGSVEQAAKALWIAREHLGRNNLQGVDDEQLDGLLHPDHLAYLREIRASGMPARYEGQRTRVQTQPHPRARENLGQVYRQLMKDVAKHRVLVVNAEHENLSHTASSPFEAVPKMLPNRTLSTEVRLVHDQRNINGGTSKDLHPPATQPLHAQIVRRVLFWKSMFPGLPVVMAKKDVAGAFRLLWVDPRDVELFAGDVPWKPMLMGGGAGKVEEGDPHGLTLLFLVSSFGFSGSPGEWNAWGRGTEELHRCFRPEKSRKDGSANFDGKILVDDMVLVEPCVGLRPWVSSETYEWAVRQLLGSHAINAAKDAEEGAFSHTQTVWGVNIDAEKEKMSLPEARVLKGAYLLSEPQFNFGERTVTLKDMQRFRGIATGWATVVKGLKNELKAADRFLGGVDGGATASPSGCEGEAAEETAWEDLWMLFEDCRWLCSRSETWSEKFGGDIREALTPLERLAVPDKKFQAAVFVSSDATPTVLGAIDWTNGVACREEVGMLRPWIQRVLEAEQLQEEGPLAIHLGEMLSFVAFACEVGHLWTGKVVLYGGDNKTVYHWIASRRSGVRAGRLLIRVLNLVEMRYRCMIIGGWWRTYHNEDADEITRLPEEQAMQKILDRGWRPVDLKQAICQALEDTERFGPCFLSWKEDEDRYEQMKLREIRMFRSLHKQPRSFGSLEIIEWTAKQRNVLDFAYFNLAEEDKRHRVVAATIGPDPRGRVVQRFWDYLLAEEFDVAILEGPRDVSWEKAKQFAETNGWRTYTVEFLTAELGEALVRRRIALFVCRQMVEQEKVEAWLVKEVNPPSLGTVLDRAKEASWRKWCKWEAAHGQGDHPMLPKVGGHVWFEEQGQRQMAYKLNGPCRWPLLKEDVGVEELYVIDRAAPAGHVRVLRPEEVWRAQGRTRQEWRALVELVGEEEALRQGCLGTGRHTALSLLGVALEMCQEGVEGKAGMCPDAEDVKSMGLLLAWLRRWRRGEFGRANPDRKAGGTSSRQAWCWGETLWLEALETEESYEDRAGGRAKSPKVKKAVASQVVELRPGLVGDFNIQAQVEEWLEEHMDGDKAVSTKRAFQAAWEKWCDWSKRQKWMSPYLSYAADPVENENKLLGYLGYLGWLGTSVATLKQAVFAIKDAHKRAGHGDATGKMHRLWIVINSLERCSVKKPRRLGVTVPMLKWIGKQFEEGAAAHGELKVNCRVMVASLLTAWFFMLRAKEFCDSSGVDEEMILRGQDVQFTIKGEVVREKAEEVTIQFRKTKVDQAAFGTCRTLLRTGVKHMCVVSALEDLKEVAPRRFGEGPEVHLPLFRWASGQVLRRLEVQHILQRAAREVGLPAERFQSHSLRIGGASALCQATGEVEIEFRWTSSAVHRYLHDGGDVIKGIAKQMAEVDQYVHYT